MSLSRRQALKGFASGFGMLGLANLLASDVMAGAGNPLSLRAPMFAPRAKRVIFLFMSGGPSHVDLLDPKPRLVTGHRQAAAVRQARADADARPAICLALHTSLPSTANAARKSASCCRISLRAWTTFA